MERLGDTKTLCAGAIQGARETPGKHQWGWGEGYFSSVKLISQINMTVSKHTGWIFGYVIPNNQTFILDGGNSGEGMWVVLKSWGQPARKQRPQTHRPQTHRHQELDSTNLSELRSRSFPEPTGRSSAQARLGV